MLKIKKARNNFRNFLIFITMMGAIIHILGLLNIIPHPTLIVDLSMLFIDLLVIYGLIRKVVWSYYLAVALYLQQSIMQPYWSYHKYTNGFIIIHPMEYFLAPFIVILALTILIFNKNHFVE